MSFEESKTLAWIRDLYRLSHATTSPGGRRLPDVMLNHIVETFEAPCGTLAMRIDMNRPDLMIVANQGDSGYMVGSLVREDDKLLGQAIAKAAPLANHILSDTAASGCPSVTSSSVLCWPLMMENQVIGALCVRRLPGQLPFTCQDLERGATLTAFLSIVVDNSRLHEEQCRRIEELSRANAEVQAINRRLKDTQHQLLQSEKMASIGQLAAGVAHEINNPIGYVHSNLGSLEHYIADVFRILDAYNTVAQKMEAPTGLFTEVNELRSHLDIDYLQQDVHELLAETREGIGRVKKIVQDLKDFSRAGAEDDWQWADLHKGLDSTLNIVSNEIKYKARVVKDYGDLPEIECLPSQINQVFMNLLVNAAHAIDGQGTITIRTGAGPDRVWVEVSDTGCGIAPENLKHIFEPFFTTKPVGQGTGLGLSLSYSIVQKHGGQIDVSSELRHGTTFCVTLPRERVARAA